MPLFGLDPRKSSADREQTLVRRESILAASVRITRRISAGGADRVEIWSSATLAFRNIGVILEFRVNGNEVVTAVELDAVSGEVATAQLAFLLSSVKDLSAAASNSRST